MYCVSTKSTHNNDSYSALSVLCQYQVNTQQWQLQHSIHHICAEMPNILSALFLWPAIILHGTWHTSCTWNASTLLIHNVQLCIEHVHLFTSFSSYFINKPPVINLRPHIKNFLHVRTQIIWSEFHVWWVWRMSWNNHSSCLHHIGPSSAWNKVLLTGKIKVKLNLYRYKPCMRTGVGEDILSLILNVGTRWNGFNFNILAGLLLGKETRGIEQENEWIPQPVWKPGKS